MAVIGSLGAVRFTASTRRVLNFSDYSRKGSAKLADHEVILEKTTTEWVGLDPEEITLDINLHRFYKARPEKAIAKLRAMRDTGELVPFILGGKPVSQNKWIVQDLSEKIDHWGKGSTIQVGTVSVTLRECPDRSSQAETGKPTGGLQGELEEFQQRRENFEDEILDTIDDWGINL